MAQEPAVSPPAADARLERLAERCDKAGGVLMSAVAMVGRNAENALERLPDGVKDLIERATVSALTAACDTAGRIAGSRATPRLGDRASRVMVTLSGAAGGFGGLASALVELPVTVTLIFGAIRRVAVSHGFDPDDPAVRAECLRVFDSGGPLAEDDDVNSSFLSARLVVNGATVNALIRSVAPRAASVLAQKLAAQTVPLLGAVAGAGVNYSFMRYYEEMAHVRFGLMQVAQELGEEEALRRFGEAVRRRKAQRRLR